MGRKAASPARAAGAAAVLALAAQVAGCGADDEPPALSGGPADPTDARAVAAGEAVYRTHCASCHGTELQGQPNWQDPLPNGSYPAPPHDGTGHTWRHSDQQLFDATKQGGGASAAPGSPSGMPGFANVLSDDEIWSALAYLKSRWPAELQARQRLLTRARGRREGGEAAGHAGHTGPAAADTP